VAERKRTSGFDRPGGYALPKGATGVLRKAAVELVKADIRMMGDRVPAHVVPRGPIKPAHVAGDPDTRLYVGDCRDVLPRLPDQGHVDLIFADPPFNWEVPYEGWADGMPRDA